MVQTVSTIKKKTFTHLEIHQQREQGIILFIVDIPEFFDLFGFSFHHNTFVPALLHFQ